jgi:hypothetical protein
MDPNRKFVVESGPVPRGNSISDDEISQAIRDILSWLSSNIPSFSPNGPALASPLHSSTLNKLLGIHNGNIQLHDTFKTLSLDEISSSNEECKVSIYWDNSYIPIAKNIDGEYLVLDLANNEKVLQWSLDEGVVEQVAESLGLYLENLRNDMLSGKLIYMDDDMGLVEQIK